MACANFKIRSPASEKFVLVTRIFLMIRMIIYHTPFDQISAKIMPIYGARRSLPILALLIVFWRLAA
jgi:hypothetical protein